MADVALARFWRSCGEQETTNEATSSWTTLYRIAQYPQCRRFLVAQSKIWAERVAANPEEADAHATYASFCEKLGDFETASEEYGIAANLSPHTSFEYHLARARRQLLAWQAQNTQLSATPQTNSLQSVPRRKASELSYLEFLRDYASKGIPVVITGLALTATPWTMDHLRRAIGGRKAPVKKAVAESVLWARLEDAGEMTISDFIDQMQEGKSTSYIHDWGLSSQCDELLSELTMPKYFIGDVLQFLPAGSMYRDSWPSLFLGPKGTESALHIDAFRSNFWMALFEGRKRWVFFHPEDWALLYPVFANGGLDPVFQVDLKASVAEQKDRFPLFQRARCYECVLEAGEILFVPAGSPHYVENLSHTVAISANYIDLSNFDAACRELEIMGCVDPRAQEVASGLRQAELLPRVCAVLRDLAREVDPSNSDSCSSRTCDPGDSLLNQVPDDLPHIPYQRFKTLRDTRVLEAPSLTLDSSDEDDDGTERLLLTALAQSRPNKPPAAKKKKLF